MVLNMAEEDFPTQKKNFILEIWFLSVNHQNITAHAAFLVPSCPRF